MQVSKVTGQGENTRRFESCYDHVFQEAATQADVFGHVANRITDALGGYNSTIFA